VVSLRYPPLDAPKQVVDVCDHLPVASATITCQGTPI